ncbi:MULTISPECIES: hypothetical protein [Brevibacillus]|uniref:hypothetical protein n=1 Tax=Brevibacillus TaxID=55080 RepID=UPI000ED80D0E|nr:hypothetical protein [Brevibacillus sp.]HBZ80242.1 hypothetical protein [Brevibacillus sp.]
MIDQHGYGRCDQCNSYFEEDLEELILRNSSHSLVWHFCSWRCLTHYSRKVIELIIDVDEETRKVSDITVIQSGQAERK